jgi:hypothetical protein
MTSPRSAIEGRPTPGTRLVVERYARFRPSRAAVAGPVEVDVEQLVRGGRLVGGKRRVAGGRLITGPRRMRDGWHVAGFRPVSQMRPLLGVA